MTRMMVISVYLPSDECELQEGQDTLGESYEEVPTIAFAWSHLEWIQTMSVEA